MRCIYTIGMLIMAEFIQKTAILADFSRFISRTRPEMEQDVCEGKPTLSLNVIFDPRIPQDARSAAEGGILEALLTGTAVAIRTTSHPAKKSPTVEAHGNAKATPSSFHTALYSTT